MLEFGLRMESWRYQFLLLAGFREISGNLMRDVSWNCCCCCCCCRWCNAQSPCCLSLSLCWTREHRSVCVAMLFAGYFGNAVAQTRGILANTSWSLSPLRDPRGSESLSRFVARLRKRAIPWLPVASFSSSSYEWEIRLPLRGLGTTKVANITDGGLSDVFGRSGREKNQGRTWVESRLINIWHKMMEISEITGRKVKEK